jgi:hypothetical protein
VADEQVRIDLEANDRASRKIADVAADVADLEAADPTVTIDARDNASADVADVAAEVRELTALDAEVILKARVDAAKADLAALRGDLKQTQEAAERTNREMDRLGGEGGISSRGSAIAALTRPRGEAAGAASDFAGVVDGLTDIVGDFATQLGATPAMAQRIGSALGGLGIVVAAGAAVWSLWSGAQKKAEEQARENTAAQRELTEAIRAGNREAAATKFGELYGDAIRLARELGVETKAAVAFITGERRTFGVEGLDLTVEDFKALNDELTKARDNYEQSTASAVIAEEQHKEVGLALVGLGRDAGDAERGMAGLAGEVDRGAEANRRHKRSVDDSRDALDRFRSALSMEQALLTFQRNVGDALTSIAEDGAASAEQVLAIKQSILDVATYAKLTPVQVKTLLEKVDNNDLLGVAADVAGYYERNPVTVTTRLGLPVNFGDERRYSGGAPSATSAAMVAGDTVNVYQTIPRGFRGDALAEARAAARRSGRLYRRAG